jgi:hypothetical protein
LRRVSVGDADSAERALLRLEWKAAQSSVDEAAAVRELLARVQRMSDACAELRSILVSMPTLPATVVPLEPAAPPAPAADTHSDVATDPALEVNDDPQDWLRKAGGGGVAALVGLWWLARRQPRPMATEIMPSPTIVLPLAPDETSHRRRSGQHAAPPDRETWPVELGPEDAEALDEGSLSLKLADIMISIGLTQGAARTLEAYVRSHPRQALYQWLKLLDLYRHAGLRAEFDQATDRLCRQFNIAPPEWLPEESGPQDAGLEHYPHIIARLVELWPDAECAAYLQHLLLDNRDGTRTGFSQLVAEEILLLQAMLGHDHTGLSTSTN